MGEDSLRSGSRSLRVVWSLDPGGWTGVASCIVPVDSVGGDGRVVLGGAAVDVIHKARKAQMWSGGELRSSDWREHVDLIIRGISTSYIWAMDKARRLAGYSDDVSMVVVCEDFDLRSGVHTGEVIRPIQIGSALSYELSRRLKNMEVEFILQTAAQKAQISDIRLKGWNLYERGQPHLNDSIRHLLVYLRSIEKGLN